MMVNPDKFQAMILSYDKKENRYTLNINDSHVTSEDSNILLHVEINNKIKSENDIYILCRKECKQVNAIIRIQHYLGKKEKTYNKLFCILKFHVSFNYMVFLF